MKEQIEEGIDYFCHRVAELEEAKWRESGKPDFMDTTGLREQAMIEAINLVVQGIREEIEKVENPYDEGEGNIVTEGRLWGAFEEDRDTILKALK